MIIKKAHALKVLIFTSYSQLIASRAKLGIRYWYLSFLVAPDYFWIV
jgi:hypothetical protein